MNNIVLRKFFLWEAKNGVLNIRNERGDYVWDIIRNDVFMHILRDKDCCKNSKDSRLTIRKKNPVVRICGVIIHILYLMFNRGEYFFLTCARDYINGKFIDKNSHSTIEAVGLRNSFIIETDPNFWAANYYYKSNSTIFYNTFLRKIVKFKYDFSGILKIIKEEYEYVNITTDDLNRIYTQFYIDYYFYIVLFSLHHFKKIFVIQNGYQKGLFYAARKKGIDCLEFQHGQICSSHIAYSYYQDTNQQSLYLPNKLLLHGDHWMDKCYLPGVDFITIGNNYIFQSIHSSMQFEDSLSKSVLVISADIYKSSLCDLVRSILSFSNKNIKFIFKLHPNEYTDMEKVKRYFSDKANVEVVKDEYSTTELLNKVDYVLIVQSTVGYEAVERGCKVLIYQIMDYFTMEDIFDCNGIYFFSDANEFWDQYNKHINEHFKEQPYFYSPLNEIALKAIINN